MLDRGSRVRGAMVVAAVAAATVTGGCFLKSRGVQPEPAPVVLEVSNRGFFDVDIYALTSSVGSGSRMRLGTVSGFSSLKLTLTPRYLQPGGVLVVRLHGIGTNVSWDSPGVSVGPGDHVALDIYADANGTLNRSQLFVLAPPDTGWGGGPRGLDSGPMRR